MNKKWNRINAHQRSLYINDSYTSMIHVHQWSLSIIMNVILLYISTEAHLNTNPIIQLLITWCSVRYNRTSITYFPRWLFGNWLWKTLYYICYIMERVVISLTTQSSRFRYGLLCFTRVLNQYSFAWAVLRGAPWNTQYQHRRWFYSLKRLFKLFHLYSDQRSTTKARLCISLLA